MAKTLFVIRVMMVVLGGVIYASALSKAVWLRDTVRALALILSDELAVAGPRLLVFVEILDCKGILIRSCVSCTCAVD